MSWTQPTPEQANVKALFYGRSGMGKTRAAGTVNRDPKKVDTLVLNTEGNGWQTIVSQLGYKPYVEHITSYDQALKVLDQLERDPGPIRNVIVDSATELGVLVLDAIVGGRQPKIQDFGTLSKRLGILFRRLRDLPMNVVFTALVADIKHGEDVVGEQPSILGSTKELLPALVDAVFYITSDGKSYVAQTKPAKGRVAKCRGNALPIIVPTDDLWGAVMRAFDLPGAPPEPKPDAPAEDAKGAPEAKAEDTTPEPEKATA